MRQLVLPGLLWFSAIGCGLMAGVYFAFSAFIMTSLGRLEPSAGVAAMNAINLDIVRSPFMPLFLGTTLAGAVLAVMAGVSWDEPGALPTLAGGVVYVLGMFVLTVVCNVPLNDALAAADPAASPTAARWSDYLKDWTFWNHVRTVASTAACALFIAAIAAR